MVVLVGPNGAGKTNLVEAISFFVPGRGLRRATLDEVAFGEGDGSWAVSAEVEGALGLATLGTGIEPQHEGETATTRQCRIDREPVSSAAAFADHLRVIWLTPGDGRLVLRTRLRAAALPRPSGGRGRCRAPKPRLGAGALAALAQPPAGRRRAHDPHWLDAVEHETAELAIAVAALARGNRRAPAGRARAKPATIDSHFPFAEIALSGWIEQMLRDHPATEIEDRYRAVLKENRARDAAAGRTLDGPHLTDLTVVYGPKNIPASDASTGEQKAVLIRLVLAHCGLLEEMTGFAPILLLDEVAAHLDPARRAALFDALSQLGAQVWMTGADPAGVLRNFRPRADFRGQSGHASRRKNRAADSIFLSLYSRQILVLLKA